MATLPPSSSADRSSLDIGSGRLSGDVTPHQCHADRRSAAEVGGAGGAGDGVAGAVQARYRAVADVTHATVGVDAGTTARADGAEVDRQRVVRTPFDAAEVRMGGRRIAVEPVVEAVAAAEVPVPALGDEGVPALHGFAEPRCVDAGGGGQPVEGVVDEQPVRVR